MRPHHEEVNPHLGYFEENLAHKGASYGKDNHRATWPSGSGLAHSKQALSAKGS